METKTHPCVDDVQGHGPKDPPRQRMNLDNRSKA